MTGLTFDVVLRIIAAALECRAAELRNATPEQVQAIVTRHEAFVAPFMRLYTKLAGEQ